jgi:hypothetical protein
MVTVDLLDFVGSAQHAIALEIPKTIAVKYHTFSILAKSNYANIFATSFSTSAKKGASNLITLSSLPSCLW